MVEIHNTLLFVFANEDIINQGCLDNFGNQNEFWYASRNDNENENGSAPRKDDKWWLPTVRVPQEGLSDVSRKWLQFQKESVNQVLKAAMAINAQVLSEMEIPENYIESLPKVYYTRISYNCTNIVSTRCFFIIFPLFV